MKMALRGSMRSGCPRVATRSRAERARAGLCPWRFGRRDRERSRTRRGELDLRGPTRPTERLAASARPSNACSHLRRNSRIWLPDGLPCCCGPRFRQRRGSRGFRFQGQDFRIAACEESGCVDHAQTTDAACDDTTLGDAARIVRPLTLDSRHGQRRAPRSPETGSVSLE